MDVMNMFLLKINKRLSIMNRISSNFDSSNILSELDMHGFVIARDVIPLDFIERQKYKWLKKFNKKNVTRRFVRGDLVLGEENFLSYSDIPGWCMYRNFEFLWNKIEDNEQMEVHLSLHRFRNLLQGYPENYGIEYNPLNYGFYISTSLYESGMGHLNFHADGHGVDPILHYMLPLTFKGVDYDNGGLYCINKSGIKCDIDSMVRPGDVIFFDGRIEHGIEKVSSDSFGKVGRIAQFSVPTFFIKDARSKVLQRSSAIFLREVANRLGIINL